MMALPIRLFWLFLVSFSSVEASRKTGNSHGSKSGGLWGTLSNYAASMLGGGVDNQPSYGQLFDYERKLQQKFNEMSEQFATADFSNWNPIKFPEATAFSSTFIRDIGGLLEFWTDLVESKKIRQNSRKISQHILWSRTVFSGEKGSISYFIYRPSFEADLDKSTILPHLKYHAEAQETFQAVHEIISQFPNDQIIFVGLQSAGAIAMLHAWMAISSVPILHRNLIQYTGELHQIKIILFDSDCILSETYALNFPIPAWDILRFYSGFRRDLKTDSCKFESMTPVGLAYPYVPNWFEYFTPSVDTAAITRAQFVEYFVKNHRLSGSSGVAASNEDVSGMDVGAEDAEEVFDESRSVVESEISMSVDERGAHVTNIPRTPSFRKQPSVQVQSIEENIKPGIELLKNSVVVAQFFFRNLKSIFLSHQKFYLQRNVNGCAAAMERNLKSTLTGSEKDQPLIPKGIKDVSCTVKYYDEKSKVALVVCDLVGNDSTTSSILQFRTHVQNKTDLTLITSKKVTIDDGDCEEISLTAGDDEFDRPRARSDQSQKEGGNSFYDREDVFFDDRSHITGFQEKSEHWTSYLEELFKQVPYLNFINPLGKHHSSLKSVVTTAGQTAPGFSVLPITLPFSSTLATYLVLAQTMPPVCSRILEPPNIPRNKLGNAESHAQTLNGYFNSDGTADINFGNTIVNGIEIEESTSNLPGNDPYAVFTPSLCTKIAECLTQNVVDKLYDCNSPLNLWAGRHHCPAVCLYKTRLHLCSRVADCGEGIFLGFRGCKALGAEESLAKEFDNVSLLNQVNPPAYYAAFHLKHVEGWSATLKRPLRFALFFSEPARTTYLPDSASIPVSNGAAISSASSVASLRKRSSSSQQSLSSQHQITAHNLAAFSQQIGVDDDDEDEEFYNFTRADEKSSRKVSESEAEDLYLLNRVASHPSPALVYENENENENGDDIDHQFEEFEQLVEGTEGRSGNEDEKVDFAFADEEEEEIAVAVPRQIQIQDQPQDQIFAQVTNYSFDQTDAEGSSLNDQIDEASMEKGTVMSATSADTDAAASASASTPVKSVAGAAGQGNKKKKKGKK